MSYKRAIVHKYLLLLTLAGCAASGSGAVPVWAPGSTALVGADKAGTLTLYPDHEGDPLPAGIVEGPDGAMWFTDQGNSQVVRILGNGKYTLKVASEYGVSDGITVGPDKNLWFTASYAIGQLTTKGKVTFFTDPDASFPQQITTGPDGALWFTNENGTVGRITLTGTIKHYSVAPSNAELQGIVTGPDGNLWITQYIVGGSHFSNRVIRVSTSGAHKSFTIGTSTYPGPDCITVGPDKALWFTEANANALGRLTTGGKYTEFPTGYEYMQPSGIATGPDRALWFTDFSGRAGIGRMTTSGTTTFYKVPGSLPEVVEITNGPKATMWFTTELGPSAIGKVTTR